MFKPLKQPTTYQQQITILQSRKIQISDAQEAVRFLANVNYYRFTGYLLPFWDRQNNQCTNPTSFDRIASIYSFDSELRTLLASTIERIEIFIRSRLAYYSAHHYGADGYMNASFYNARHDHIKFMGLLNQCIQDNKKSPVVRHHIQTYGGSFPIWVIIDYFSLGMLSHFYTDMKNPDKSFIAKDLYSVNYQTLTSWLRCLTDLRNRCAHYSRLYYWIFPAVPRMPTGNIFQTDRRLFTQLYMLKLLYPDTKNWNTDFIAPLSKLLSQYTQQISLDHIGFPQNWESILSQ